MCTLCGCMMNDPWGICYILLAGRWVRLAEGGWDSILRILAAVASPSPLSPVTGVKDGFNTKSTGEKLESWNASVLGTQHDVYTCRNLAAKGTHRHCWSLLGCMHSSLLAHPEHIDQALEVHWLIQVVELCLQREKPQQWLDGTCD